MARILQVTASTDRRGAEVFAHHLEGALTRSGHHVRTVAVAGRINGTDLPFEVLGPGPRAPGTLRSLTRAARGADVVVVHGSSGLWPALVACRLTLRPWVYRSIGDPDFWARRRTARVRTGWALRRAARVVALSEGLRNSLIERYGLNPDRVAVSPNAVDAERFPAASPSDRAHARRRLRVTTQGPLVGYLGALSPEKRPDWTVKAIAELAGVRLVVAGTGPLRARLRELAHRLAPGRVTFVDALAEPWLLLAAVDVLVLPSRTEGMPGVVIEAGLAGRPVVATAVGAVAEMIGPVAGGLATPPEDFDAFVEGVRCVLDDGGAPAPTRDSVVARHDLDAVTPAWSTLLDEVSCGDPHR